MSIRHILTGAELQRLSQLDRAYLRRKLNEHCMLNQLLHKSVNQRLLQELQCILDKQPLPRQKAGQYVMRQISRLTDGIKRPITVRKMTVEEIAIYNGGK